MTVVLIDYEMTCSACPSQWEGTTHDGGSFYARYRYGSFTAEVDGRYIHEEQVGDGMDGVMSTSEMQEILKDKVKFDGEFK